MNNRMSLISGTDYQPLVSIIVNCFNGEKYLTDAINSILAQTYRDFEVIFWDNQSSDFSADIFKGYNDPRFKYFYAPSHTLLYEARNRAIEKSCGEFLAFLDVDDWWYPEKLEMQIPLFNDLKVGFVCSNYWIIKHGSKHKKKFRNKSIPSGFVLNDLLMDYSVGLLTLILRRSAFDSLSDGCDPRYHIIGDLDLVIRLSMKWKMASCQEPLAFYRLHGENEGQKQKDRQVSEYKTWVQELAQKPQIHNLPGYQKVINELIYMQGRLCLSQGRKGACCFHLNKLSWGKFKFKLLGMLVVPYKLLHSFGL